MNALFLVLAEEHSTAYDIGYVFGRALLIIIVVVAAVWLFRWANRRWPGSRE